MQPILVALVLALAFSFPHIANASGEVDRVFVDKSDRVLYLMAGQQVVRRYDISLGASPVGHKVREGDERTPEGRYVLDWKNDNSKFFRSIRISYPNRTDQARAEAGGYSAGSNIFIHGLPNNSASHGRHFAGKDWTDGCIAVNNNAQMSEIWNLLRIGTVIEIVP
jgi:murein L,D-transpeptidase YafK